jgi:hypothetical protein
MNEALSPTRYSLFVRVLTPQAGQSTGAGPSLSSARGKAAMNVGWAEESWDRTFVPLLRGAGGVYGGAGVSVQGITRMESSMVTKILGCGESIAGRDGH